MVSWAGGSTFIDPRSWANILEASTPSNYPDFVISFAERWTVGLCVPAVWYVTRCHDEVADIGIQRSLARSHTDADGRKATILSAECGNIAAIDILPPPPPVVAHDSLQV
jgi:hypothetical protein